MPDVAGFQGGAGVEVVEGDEVHYLVGDVEVGFWRGES